MPDLIITVDFEDETDLDFARMRMVGLIEELIEEYRDEGHFDGKVDVGWKIDLEA